MSRDCGKKAYESYLLAQQVIAAMKTRDRRMGRTIRNQEIYRCPECKVWHLTSHSYGKQRKDAA